MIQIASNPLAARDPLRAFIAKMREATPFGDLSWDEPMWDVTDVLTRSGKRLHISTRNRFWFVEHQESRGDERLPFILPFADFAKAILCARHIRGSQVAGAHMVSLRALRYLYAATKRAGTVNPRNLTHGHFRAAESAALEREKISSAYRIGQRLEEIAALIDQHGITPIKIEYRSSIPKSSVESISSKMPSQKALDALAHVSGADQYENSVDLILIRIVDLLVATGMRVGEVLTLPESPIVRKKGEIGLRYWPEKGGEARIRPLASVHRELVERAVVDLNKACAKARRLAKKIEKDVGYTRLPPDVPEIMKTSDIEALGLDGNGLQWLHTHGVRFVKRGKFVTVAKADVEAAVSRMYDKRPVVRSGDGSSQTLGQSLLVMFKNESHAGRCANRFVPVSVTLMMLANFLGSHDSLGGYSVFKRRNLRDNNGKLLRITTHQFRHWLSTIAKRGGLSEVELARWMGRKRIADNRAYDHRTMQERTEEARALIRSGRANGPIADMYASLPPVEAEDFLTAQVNGTLTTPYGLCVHDYGQGPCERHFNCAGCSELLRRKGDVDERAALGAWLDRTRTSLKSAQSEATDGAYSAGNWVKYNERLEIDLITMLAVDDDESKQDGEFVKVWPDGHGPEVEDA